MTTTLYQADTKVSELPLLYATDLVASTSEKKRHGPPLVLGTDSWVIACTGIRGSGKSLTLAYMVAHALMKGLTVWSNMNVAFRCLWPDGTIKSLASNSLDFNALYTLSSELQSGVVAIDEIQYYVDSRISGSVRNRLINATIRQVRKRTLSFLYTTRSLDWIDKRLRYWETDVEFACWDSFRSNPKVPKGTTIHLKAYDHSGAWTGRPWYPGMEPTSEFKMQCANRIWPIYRTDEIINYFEASSPIRMDMATKTISNRENIKQERLALISELAIDLKLKGMSEVPADQFRVLAKRDYDLDVNEREIGWLVRDLGIIRKRTSAGSFYNLEKVTG